jgi:hypothetical protein
MRSSSSCSYKDAGRTSAAGGQEGEQEAPLSVLDDAPTHCRNCGVVLNVHAVVDANAGFWACLSRNALPPKLTAGGAAMHAPTAGGVFVVEALRLIAATALPLAQRQDNIDRPRLRRGPAKLRLQMHTHCSTKTLKRYINRRRDIKGRSDTLRSIELKVQQIGDAGAGNYLRSRR